LSKQHTKHSGFVFLIYQVLFSLFISNNRHESIVTVLVCQVWFKKYLFVRILIFLFLDSAQLLKLKGNFEFGVSWVGGDFFYFVLSYITGKGVLDVLDASSNIIFVALGEHFHSTIGTVSDKAGQLMTVGYVKSSVSKADTLNPADENYMFCCLAHFQSYINPSRFSLQVCI